MSNTREILSLQFGHYTNFIGTHFWNIQETSFDYSGTLQLDINNDVLYREGVSPKGELTYTPRLLLVDLKGSLNHLPIEGELYDISQDITNASNQSIATWSENNIEVQKGTKLEKNAFLKSLDDPNVKLPEDYQIDKDINVWSDYLYPRFHPRTVNIVKEYEHGNEEVPFETFNCGTSIWKTQYFEDFTDKIRNYIEECNSLQGFQVMLDAVDGFAGLSTSCIQHLYDDYNTKSIMAIPVIPSFYKDYQHSNSVEQVKSIVKDSVRLINLALCYESLTEYCSLSVPISTASKGWRQLGPSRQFKNIKYNPESFYESSALLAAAIDTFTLRYRMKSKPNLHLSDLCTSLNLLGRKIASASLSFPFPMAHNQDLIDCLDNWNGPLWESITPNCEIGTDRYLQTIQIRGIPENRLKRPPNVTSLQREMPAYKCNTVNEMLAFYLSCTSHATASDVIASEKPIKIATPFPNIFENGLNENGFIESDSQNKKITSAPIISGLHSGGGVGKMLEVLHQQAARLKIARFNQFKTSGLEQDEYSECLNRIQDLQQCYEDNYD